MSRVTEGARATAPALTADRGGAKDGALRLMFYYRNPDNPGAPLRRVELADDAAVRRVCRAKSWKQSRCWAESALRVDVERLVHGHWTLVGRRRGNAGPFEDFGYTNKGARTHEHT